MKTSMGNEISLFGWFIILLLAILVLVSGCVNAPSTGSETGTTVEAQEQKAGNEQATGTGCPAGFSKTTAGKKYLRTGTENQTLQGKSMELCCWETDGQAGRKSKICCDSNLYPVGYSNGILFEMDKTGAWHMTMETYQKDGKKCQQQYNSDGTKGPEHCN
jgi:hypothetical protein